ncbi:hypothetical protein [Candidatus Cytomitobacter primus]|uniref:Uncharacterized protein n=1 Tax=Candidatus Cytomitobacter primus TaxID=2066024 RepID=A0A5C0UG31_9PROT|nr:hypothetical protein [Candidatus Cytomitobacter primus]QEK38680.1 hypothetical protein FZC34_02040 [Candidatus Cytomitobacter primus]
MNKTLFVCFAVSVLGVVEHEWKDLKEVEDGGFVANTHSLHNMEFPYFDADKALGKVVKQYCCGVRGWVSVHERSIDTYVEDLGKKLAEYENALKENSAYSSEQRKKIADYESVLSKNDPYFDYIRSIDSYDELNLVNRNSSSGESLSERSTSNSMGHESDEVVQGHKSTEAYMIDKNVLNSSSVNTVYVELNKLADFKA